MRLLNFVRISFACAVNRYVALLPTLVAFPIREWHITSFASRALVFATSVTALSVALAFGVLAIGNTSPTFAITFALAFTFAAINRNVSE